MLRNENRIGKLWQTVGWIELANADTYNIDTNEIAVGGASAGANQYDGTWNIQSRRFPR